MYKADNGVYLTQGLFFEWNKQDAPFSMRDSGKEEYYVARSGTKYKSFPYLYRQYADEYEFAIAVLGSWEHWKKLQSADWFLTGNILGSQYSGLNDWREEKLLSDKSKAKQVILEKIQEGDLQAAKFLYGEKQVGTKAGRPEKPKAPKPKASVSELAKRIRA